MHASGSPYWHKAIDRVVNLLPTLGGDRSRHHAGFLAKSGKTRPIYCKICRVCTAGMSLRSGWPDKKKKKKTWITTQPFLSRSKPSKLNEKRTINYEFIFRSLYVEVFCSKWVGSILWNNDLKTWRHRNVAKESLDAINYYFFVFKAKMNAHKWHTFYRCQCC